MSEGQKLIATNPNAKRNFFISEVVEAGLVLTGTEIKSLRIDSPKLNDSFVELRTRSGSVEAWLLHTHIAPYKHGNIWNHEPMRPRKLLLHRHQLKKLHGAMTQEGFALVPTRMYFVKGRAKVEIGLGKGKKKHDKRQDLKERSAKKEIRQALKKNR